MKKTLTRFGIGLATIAVVVAGAAAFSAFEAHVINVTAKIENALNVPLRALNFGTVFPQEKLDKTFDVTLSQSFQDEDRVDDVDYFIRQKPKCGLPVVGTPTNGQEYSAFGQVTEDANGGFKCVDADKGYVMLPLLCPYLSKSEITTDGTGAENDGAALSAFHGPINLVDWNLAVAKSFDVKGHLVKAAGDISDTWNIDLKVPCFGGHCAQDWESFVEDVNPNAIAANYVQPIANEHKLYGCDLWLEVFSISLPGNDLCSEQADIMLVLDESGSIAGPPDNMPTLKNAANSFVDALQLNGAHAGMVSFSATAALDVHVDNNDPNVLHTAINAMTASGMTNLEDALQDATAELDNPGDGHDRADATSPDFIVLITDGAPTTSNSGGDPATDAAAAAAAAKAAGITIYVVGVNVTPATSAYLSGTIATSVDDHYFDVENFEDLEAILLQLASCPE